MTDQAPRSEAFPHSSDDEVDRVTHDEGTKGGDELIGVVRETVGELERLTNRLQSYLNDLGNNNADSTLDLGEPGGK